MVKLKLFANIKAHGIDDDFQSIFLSREKKKKSKD